ncbi:MAG: type VI secretion system-associated FHA domain protein TagH [Gammaproteobacteria bacterium]|nr:type VI secretion system-associated FHA domain protein TagH [Gammaproteobacteria bacterium]
MALRLRITSQQKGQLGESHVREFVACGGTIGRAEDNDWILPDAKRFISSRHALVDFQGGAYYLVDTSRNGVYINGSDTAVGRGHPQRLFNGDRLRMGEYEITVELTAGDEHIADDGMRDSVVRAQLVPVDESMELQLVDENKMRAFEYNALERHLKPAEPGASGRTRQPAPAAPPGPPAEAGRMPERRPAPASGHAAAVEIFCKAAGLAPADLRGTNPEEILGIAGALTRELLTGLADLLQSRSRMKDALRLPQTVIRPAANNPLKFSPNVAEALRYLLGEPGQSYLPPDRAVQAAFQDVRSHQQALFKAMIHAVRDFAERLEPDELRSRFDRGLKRSPLLAGANKLKYWELYEESYLTLTHQEEGAPLPAIVIDELTKAYEQELEILQHGATRPIASRPAQAS